MIKAAKMLQMDADATSNRSNRILPCFNHSKSQYQERPELPKDEAVGLNGISDSLEELAGKASSVVPSAFPPLEDFYNEFLNDFRSRWYDQDKSVDRKYFIAALLDPRIKRDYLCKFELEGQKLL